MVSLQPADTALTRLQADIAALLERFDGEAGVAAVHVESGRGIAASGERPFFLASVYKLPIAIALLRRVEAGTIALSDSVRLEPWDFRLGRATLAPNRPGGAGAYTVARLLESALRDSDNSASDALLALAGGPAAIVDTLRALGLDGIGIHRSEGEFLLDYYGLPDSLPIEERTPARVTSLLQAVPAPVRESARQRFASDVRDAASALSLAELLERLWRGELLSPAGTRRLLGHLRHGWIDTRLVAGLPSGTPIWHKTGSWREAATHDAGIVELPDGTHLVLVVLVRQPRPDGAAAERLIADVARTAWRFWTEGPEP